MSRGKFRVFNVLVFAEELCKLLALNREKSSFALEGRRKGNDVFGDSQSSTL